LALIASETLALQTEMPPRKPMPFPVTHRLHTLFRIRNAIIALAIAIVFGTVGFTLIEGWSFGESFYVTMQTLTTVGYGDIPPRSVAGRDFAVLIMLMGVGGVALGATTIVQSIVQSELLSTFGQRRQSRRMRKLHDHYIICGSGRVGSHLVRDLQRSDKDMIIIERDSVRAAEFSQRGFNVLIGDATLEDTMREAGVERAQGLAACLPDDADNVYVVLTARDLNPRLHIVARAVEEQAEAKLVRAGANHVVAPTIIGGHRMAVSLTKPAVGEFFDSITGSKIGLGFEQVVIERGSPLVGRPLRETPIRAELDIVIISIRRADGEMLFNPAADTIIDAGDILIAIGQIEALTRLNEMAR
jgi:voltage-gated potassium channel